MPAFASSLILRAYSASEVERAESPRQLYEVREPFVFESAALGRIEVSPGFVTDFASIPRIACGWLDPEDPAILFASVVHDWLYARAGILSDGRRCTRAQADTVLREAMIASGARPTQVAVVHAAVRLFGASRWGVLP